MTGVVASRDAIGSPGVASSPCGFGAAEDPVVLGAPGAAAGVFGGGVMTPMFASAAASSPLTGIVVATLVTPAQMKITPSARRRKRGAQQGLQDLVAMVVLRKRQGGPLSGPVAP